MGLKKPIKLVVNGKNAPIQARENMLTHLPNDLFWKEVYKLGGIPEEINNHPELLEYFTPILKADFCCTENYQYDKNSSKLTTPIDVFHGSDEEITQAEAEAWQEETTANVNVTELKGNHFFIFEHKYFFVEYFKNLQLDATI
jgi:surfactin synthase thioesterase subunit